MSSYDEFRKMKLKNNSYQEFKEKKQNPASITTNNNASNKTSLWDNIKKIAGNAGRVADNLRLGGSSGSKQALNFSFITANERNKTEQQVKNQRVLGSKELSNSEKATYIASQNKSNNENTANLPTINLPTNKSYDKNKVEDIANYSVLDKSIQKDQVKIQENIEQQTDAVSKKLAELAPSIGNMAVGAAASTVAPSLGTTYFITSAGGSYMQDALDREMSRKEAIQYGKIMGAMEGATEAISVGTLSKAGKGVKALIKGSGKEIIKDSAEGIAKNSLKSVLKDYGIGIAENAIQEAIIEPIQEVVAGQIGGKDKTNWNDIGQRMLQSGIDGGLTSAILGGANLGIESCIGVVEKTQNGKSITKQELQTAVKDASKQLDVEKMITDSTRQQINKYKTSQKQPQSTPNAQSIPNQQIMPMQEKNTQKGISEQVNKNTSKRFQEGLEKFKSGKYNQYDNIVVLEETPQYLYNKGYEYEQPIVINMDKLNTIMKVPKGNVNGKNQHGITMDIIEQLPEAISNPLNVIKNPKYNNRYVIVTELTDQYGDIVIVPIEMNTKGHIEGIRTDVNRASTVYGKEYYDLPKDNKIESYMERNKDNIVYDIDTYNKRSSNVSYRLQLPSSNTTASITNSIPLNTKNVNGNTTSNYSMQESENNSVSFNMPISEDTKARKHYKSIMESQYASDEAKMIAKELMGTDTYVPDSNESQLQRANERIQRSTPDSELNSLMGRALTGGNIKAEDIAVGERLIQYYSKTGNKAKLQEAIQATAMAGTSAGQTVQALSLLNHQTPEGQAIWLQRSVDKMNNELKKNRGENAEQFNLTQDMVDKIVNSKDTEELQTNLDEVYKELGQQVSKSNLQKLDAWRYFAMLANPKTHIRNIVGNTAMSGVQGVKNKVAGAIEGVVNKINPNIERTHTIMRASKEIRTFAKNDIKNVADRLGLNENKYNPKTRLENSMRTFKNDTLENTIGKLFDLNDNLLEAEDGWGLKAGYTKALSEYMTANKLDPNTITDKQLAKARNYAVEQAQEATFHQASSIATALNQFSNKNKLTKFIMDSTLPFKKTPINVAKAGLEYSPAGLAKSLLYDTVKLRKGNITVNKYIDNISKGLTGTGVALLGYALADAGILKASGSDDDDKEKYDEQMGKQTYSITIAGNTYSLDWLAPTGIPLFIGAECYEIMQTEAEETTSSSDEDSTYNKAIKSATNILDSFTNAMNPMTEMSMLSGLTSALKSYDQGSSQMLASLGTNAVKSYVNQFVPTAVGQIARTTDEYERDTISTKTGVLPRAIDTTKNQIMNKIPGLRQMLPTKTDIWGKEVKQADNVIRRGLENAVFPWTRKEVSTSKVDNSLTELYDEIGESSILPDTLNKKLTINGQDYRLTNEEYSKYKTAYGETSYKLLNSLVSSNEYKNMTNKQKQVAIESIYDYAKEQNKVNYAENIGEEIETSTTYNVLKALEKGGGNQSQYLSFVGKTKDIQGEKATQRKNKVLLDLNYSSTTKSIIYENTTGKDDNLYNILSNGNVNINEYLDYKIRDSKYEFSADKNSDGESISGSSKKKVYNYVNNNITGVGNRLIILGNQYKLKDNERKALSEYINKIIPKAKDRIEVYKKITKNFVVKNGKVYYK